MLRTWTALKSVRLSPFTEPMANTCIRPMRLRGRLERLLLICFARWLRACHAFTFPNTIEIVPSREAACLPAAGGLRTYMGRHCALRLRYTLEFADRALSALRHAT